MVIKTIENEMKRLANAKKEKLLAGFFKTGPGQYGAGDIFLGVMVPQTRSVAKKHWQKISLVEIQKLISSKYHEIRLLGLIMLTMQFTKTGESAQNKIFNFYLKNTTRINNWDLVDLSAPNIIGTWLLNRDRKILYKLACSKNLWEKRIAIISTAAFIRAGQFDDTIKISKILLNDSHDLIHKAVGWMLREVGKRNLPILENFLKTHIKKIPRTTLRYAIEKFPEKKRQKYLKNPG